MLFVCGFLYVQVIYSYDGVKGSHCLEKGLLK